MPDRLPVRVNEPAGGIAHMLTFYLQLHNSSSLDGGRKGVPSGARHGAPGGDTPRLQRLPRYFVAFARALIAADMAFTRS